MADQSSQPPDPVSPAAPERKFPCPSCHAPLAFSPQQGVISCPYCGWKDRLPDSAAEIVENSFEQYLTANPEEFKPLGKSALEVACSGCGSLVTFVPPDVAGTCSFCGAAIVAEPHQADPVLAPQAVLPFSITDQQALTVTKTWIAKRWFAPNELKRFAIAKVIQGTYLPFWTYDSYSDSHYTGERGDHYYVTETYQERTAQGGWQTRTRQVRRTRWSFAQGRVSLWFDDVLIAGSSSIPRNYLDALEPWDLKSLQPYEEKLLAGFRAQRAQIDFREGFGLAKTVMEERIRRAVQQDIGGDEQRISSLNTAYSAITFKHILLPVYVGAFTFQNKVYQVLVNARTGEVQGSRPYSWVKITLAALAVLGTILLLLLIQGPRH